uniref:Uncharacterized protein n=1 Tax=Eutreptiella gymnastica TaxID=73025 RepID=A0A7S1N8R1_9EUGL|mmetsp:Transcript_139860/g.243505  ORF Transcript_139860/g.243505 Transcript_139860/m.243505 type:complete len:541 (+) Transcript_139860:2-1624(+)
MRRSRRRSKRSASRTGGTMSVDGPLSEDPIEGQNESQAAEPRPAAMSDEDEEVESRGPLSRRTRGHQQKAQHQEVSQTMHLALVVGKDQDPVVSNEWLIDAPKDMYQSDEAVGAYIALKYPHVKVTICRPKTCGIEKMADMLEDCDAIHILESEQFLGKHNYKNYKQMFKVLHGFGERLVPSLATMQYIMTKVDYIRLMEKHKIPHVPTFVLQRPNCTDFKDLQRGVSDCLNWVLGLHPVPLHIVTKPSHSGSRLHFEKWFVAGLRSAATTFATALRRMFEGSAKPFVLVQPFLQGLADLEYRLFFVNRKFVSCVSTRWGVNHQGKRDMKRANVDDKALLDVLQPIAQRVVDLLPPDSVMYRVDLFKWGDQYAVNEIEMVDADMMPEFHDDETDVIQLLAEALVQLGPGPFPKPGGKWKSALPVPDPHETVAGTAAHWEAVAAVVRGSLQDFKGARKLPSGMRDEQFPAWERWVGLLADTLLDADGLRQACEEMGLHAKGTKREMAGEIAWALLQEDERAAQQAAQPPPKKKAKKQKSSS